MASGLLAGLVAYLTVRWTQRGDSARARLVASQSAALALQRETRAAMHEIHAHLLEANAVDAAERQSQWREEMLLQRPVISSRLLQDRIDHYDAILEEMVRRTGAVWSEERSYTRDRYGNDIVRVETAVWNRRVAALVKQHSENLDAALAAHRADQPLPAALPAPNWQELPPA